MLYLKKNNGKIAGALGAPFPDLRVVTPITCYSYFLQAVYSDNLITVEKGKKNQT